MNRPLRTNLATPIKHVNFQFGMIARGIVEFSQSNYTMFLILNFIFPTLMLNSFLAELTRPSIGSQRRWSKWKKRVLVGAWRKRKNCKASRSQSRAISIRTKVRYFWRRSYLFGWIWSVLSIARERNRC